MVYLAFTFDGPDDATVTAFCSTAARLGYEVRQCPIWGRRVILCAAVPSRDESDGLDLYDALCGLVKAGRFPRWLSLGCASEAEWSAGVSLCITKDFR